MFMTCPTLCRGLGLGRIGSSHSRNLNSGGWIPGQGDYAWTSRTPQSHTKGKPESHFRPLITYIAASLLISPMDLTWPSHSSIDGISADFHLLAISIAVAVSILAIILLRTKPYNPQNRTITLHEGFTETFPLLISKVVMALAAKSIQSITAPPDMHNTCHLILISPTFPIYLGKHLYPTGCQEPTMNHNGFLVY